jgi:hypothetical protein
VPSFSPSWCHNQPFFYTKQSLRIPWKIHQQIIPKSSLALWWIYRNRYYAL